MESKTKLNLSKTRLTRKDYKALQYYKQFIASDNVKKVVSPFLPYYKNRLVPSSRPREDRGYFDLYAKRKPSVLLQNLTDYFSGELGLSLLLQETADVVKSTTKATSARVYMVDDAETEIHLVAPLESRHKINYKIGPGTTVAAYVAYTKEYFMCDDILKEPRFPDGIGYYSDTSQSVMCVPIVSPDTQGVIALMELVRDGFENPFSKDDLKSVVVVTGWMGAAIYQHQQRVELQKQKELNDYLISLTKCYFAYNVDLEKMISEIINFAKSTIGAERGSFYIFEKEGDDLLADVYDEGIEDDGMMHKKNIKLHITKDKGVPGYVAFTGESVNLRNAEFDPRFNKDVDQRPGCITKTMLCIPIRGIEGILGVLQLVNKLYGNCFTSHDEYILQTFAVYSALALHFSKILNELYISKKQNEINRGLVKYHLAPCKHDVEFFHKCSVNVPIDINEFSYYISKDQHDFMPHYVSFMLMDLIDSTEFDIDELMKFLLIVKVGYRDNGYHNFEHAFTVMNCMYNILLRNLDLFSDLEIKALLVATICHDLDHRGFTNNFLILLNDPLAQLYDESPLENHHVYMTLMVLEKCCIFPEMGADEYREFLNEIKFAIIATDLALYFKVRLKLTQICSDGFDWEIKSHRYLGKELMMTACDLSAMTKPYSSIKTVVDGLYAEFYAQGDVEKKMGLMPLSMMDRDRSYTIPEDQFQFLSVIVIPCNDLLRKILPKTADLHMGCAKLRESWREIIEMRGQKSWRQSMSIVATRESYT